MLNLRFPLLLLCCRKEHIIQNQAIAWRIRVQAQIRFWIVYEVTVILRIVTSIKSPGTLTMLAVDVPNLAPWLILS